MSLFIQELPDNDVHPALEPINRIITNELQEQLRKQIFNGRIIDLPLNKAEIQLIQFSPVSSHGLLYADFIWRFQISKQVLRISVTPTSLRVANKPLKARSKRAYSDLCAVLKSLNESTMLLDILFYMKRDWTVCLATQKKWTENNPMHKLFGQNLRKTMKNLQDNLSKSFNLLSIYLDCPQTLQNYNPKNTRFTQKQPYQAFKDLKDSKLLFERYRFTRPKASKVSFQDWSFLNHKNFLELFFLMFSKNPLNSPKSFLLPYSQKQTSYEEQVERKKQTLINSKCLEREQSPAKFLQRTNVTAVRITNTVGNEILVSEEGQHSKIFMGIYVLKVSFSINAIVQDDWQGDKRIRHPPKQITKELVKKKSYPIESSLNSFRNEVRFLRFLRGKSCPNIAQFYCQVASFSELENLQYFYLDMYKCTLKELLAKKEFSVTVKLRLLTGIVEGIRYLGEHWILHRDLKPANILIDSKLNPKIIDFGSCCSIYGYKQNFQAFDERLLSTPKYHLSYYDLQSEELESNFSEQQYDQHIFFDIYGLGQIIIDIFELKQSQLEDSLCQTTLGYLWYVAQRCKAQNPEDRLSHDELAIFIDRISQCHSLLSQM